MVSTYDFLGVVYKTTPLVYTTPGGIICSQIQQKLQLNQVAAETDA